MCPTRSHVVGDEFDGDAVGFQSLPQSAGDSLAVELMPAVEFARFALERGAEPAVNAVPVQRGLQFGAEFRTADRAGELDHRIIAGAAGLRSQTHVAFRELPDFGQYLITIEAEHRYDLAGLGVQVVGRSRNAVLHGEEQVTGRDSQHTHALFYCGAGLSQTGPCVGLGRDPKSQKDLGHVPRLAPAKDLAGVEVEEVVAQFEPAGGTVSSESRDRAGQPQRVVEQR